MSIYARCLSAGRQGDIGHDHAGLTVEETKIDDRMERILTARLDIIKMMQMNVR